MIRIAVVEDDKSYQLQLSEYLTKFMKEIGEKIEVEFFSDGIDITEGYVAKYEIILMDIQMKFMDGVTTARKIREVDTKVIIIFLTNTAQYAIKGYEVDALDYVLKPISYFAFSQKLKCAFNRLKNRKERYIVINIKRGQIRMDISDIYYIESEGHTISLATKSEKIKVIGTLKEFEDILIKENFFRANKSYLINLTHVDSVQNEEVTINGEKIWLSRMKKKDFMEALTHHWAGVDK